MALAMAFYSKLTKELKRQFKTSDIAIPETRAQCVAVAQRVWERLYPNEGRRNITLDFSALRIVKIRISLITRTPAFAASKGHNPRVRPRRLRISFGDIITIGDSDVLDIGINGVKRRIYAFYRQGS
jgi:hypothetical protein